MTFLAIFTVGLVIGFWLMWRVFNPQPVSVSQGVMDFVKHVYLQARFDVLGDFQELDEESELEEEEFDGEESECDEGEVSELFEPRLPTHYLMFFAGFFIAAFANDGYYLISGLLSGSLIYVIYKFNLAVNKGHVKKTFLYSKFILVGLIRLVVYYVWKVSGKVHSAVSKIKGKVNGTNN